MIVSTHGMLGHTHAFLLFSNLIIYVALVGYVFITRDIAFYGKIKS